MAILRGRLMTGGSASDQTAADSAPCSELSHAAPGDWDACGPRGKWKHK